MTSTSPDIIDTLWLIGDCVPSRMACPSKFFIKFDYIKIFIKFDYIKMLLKTFITRFVL